MYIIGYMTYVYLQICREQFVTLHNEPILSDLASFLEQKFGNLT